jgi:hypothetical protein
MARDDVELLTEAFELLNSDHYEQALALIDERFEMTTTPEVASEPDTYRGHDGVRRWWSRSSRPWTPCGSRRCACIRSIPAG